MNSEKIKNTLYEIGFDEKIISIKIIKNGTFEDNSFFKKVITLIVETKSHFWEFIIGQVLNYQIFCQDLVHNGWTDQTIILERSMFLKDHKRVIIYLFNTGFSINEIIWKKVNEVFLIEKKYSEVWKVYITKEKILAAFKNFLTKEKSNIIKNYSSIFDRKQKINKNLFDLGIRDFYQNKKNTSV